ncbi:MAG TPA: hypothetical protein DCW29_12680 [Janthinobacterium sp.]|nr:hypothetical protein [Janthinobacterium sp.]
MSMMLCAAPAQAQQSQSLSRSANPRIEGFNVDEVARLDPGVELSFQVYGTPGGRATLHIAGARRNLNLVEGDAGQYEGVYTISTRDRIRGDSAVSANLRVGNQVSSAILSESLLRGVGRHYAGNSGAATAAAVHVDRFDVRANGDLSPGSELAFTLFGTPGAKVDMTIAGTRGRFFLTEVRSGEYAGSYTIRHHDQVRSNSAVTANLRIGDRVATATLGKPLQMAAAAISAPERYCGNCASVEAINVVQVNGEGNYLGTIGGGLIGGLLGSQVGKGNGRTAAEVVGALGGAYAGRNVERNANHTQHYEVIVRYANGGTQTVTYENEPSLRVGDKVRVNDGVLTSDR